MSSTPSKQEAPLDAALRKALQGEPLPAPQALRNRLLLEARRQDGDLADPSLYAWTLRWAVAAVLFLSVGISAWVLSRAPEEVVLAQAALENYRHVEGLDFQGRPSEAADCCSAWSRAKLGFDAPLPMGCAPEQLSGGRVCSVKERPVAHYRLKDGRAVYVFAGPLRGCSARPALLAKAPGLQAQGWNEGGRGYVVIEAVPEKRPEAGHAP